MKIWGFPSVHPGTCKAFLIHSAFYVIIGDITMQISGGSLSMRTGLIYKTSWNPILYWAGCEGKAMWVWASAFKGRFLIYGSKANTLMDFKFFLPTRRSQPPEKNYFQIMETKKSNFCGWVNYRIYLVNPLSIKMVFVFCCGLLIRDCSLSTVSGYSGD